jgi:tricorn protease-like protein
LLRIDAAGGPPQAICTADGARGGTWGPNGVIVFGGGSTSGLSRVAASGGQATAITKADVGDHRFPSFLPDGRHVLFHMNSLGLPDKMGLYVTTIDPGPIKRLAAAQTAGVYAAPGFLLFVRQSTLIAQRFDLKALELTGEPTPVAERAESGVFSGVLAFSVSDTGTLAYGIGAGREENTQLTWFDRQGKRLEPLGQPVTYTGVDLSPDQKRVVAHRHDAGAGGDLWMIDVERGTTSRFTFDATQDNSSPVWSPDGSRVAYGSLRNGGWGLFAKASNGTAAEELVGQPAPVVGPRSWSPDGRFLVYAVSNASTGSDVWSLPLAGDRKPVPLLTTRFQERNPQLSPDGKWLAYSSDESGVPELYVRPFPAGDGKWQISTAGGWEPRWRGDSRELFYADRAQQGAIMSVDITGTGSAFSFSSPRKLFDMVALTSAHPGSSAMRYAVTRDGQRFLIPVIPRAATFSDATSPPIAVVVNWAAALGK